METEAQSEHRWQQKAVTAATWVSLLKCTALAYKAIYSPLQCDCRLAQGHVARQSQNLNTVWPQVFSWLHHPEQMRSIAVPSMGVWFQNSLWISSLQMIKSLAVSNEPGVITYMQTPAVRVGRTLEVDSEVSWENSELCSWIRYQCSWCFLNSERKVQILHYSVLFWGFPGGSVGENPPANEEDMGSIPGSGRSLGEGMATHFSILTWEMPWTAEPGWLQSRGLQENQTM